MRVNWIKNEIMKTHLMFKFLDFAANHAKATTDNKVQIFILQIPFTLFKKKNWLTAELVQLKNIKMKG